MRKTPDSLQLYKKRLRHKTFPVNFPQVRRKPANGCVQNNVHESMQIIRGVIYSAFRKMLEEHK